LSVHSLLRVRRVSHARALAPAGEQQQEAEEECEQSEEEAEAVEGTKLSFTPAAATRAARGKHMRFQSPATSQVRGTPTRTLSSRAVPVLDVCARQAPSAPVCDAKPSCCFAPAQASPVGVRTPNSSTPLGSNSSARPSPLVSALETN
jgi:hypothetical protein